VLGLYPPLDEWMQEDALEPELIEDRLRAMSDAKMAEKLAHNDPAIWRQIEKSILLQRLDHYWKEHLATLDALRQVVFLRAYAQKQPINEYKREAFGLFEKMLETIREDVTSILLKSEFHFGSPPDLAMPDLPELPDFLTGHIDPLFGTDDSGGSSLGTGREPLFRSLTGLAGASLASGGDPYAGMEISRNAPCPCGSGNKYKHCHGKLA